MSQQPSPIRLLRRPAVETIVGLKRSALYKMVADGRFPKPISLSDGKNPPVAWLEHEVMAFVEQRIARRDLAGPQ
ncbi:helix-turn-helix transcriptional regulator [Methylobacterium soli]|uniref:AlpA family phage regulatory protein n=1 Tax=Methylobacterium soli TaxID=553447 RepID=A0A6L3ST28_9HYPH|nr:AlpA family phage regulatory protein [Methylobacterium soli]